MQRRAVWMHETLNALRSQWLTGSEFAEEIGGTEWAAFRDLRELEEVGVLVCRTRVLAVRIRGQRNPVEYTLAREWGGQAA